jgi:hypothetical protein
MTFNLHFPRNRFDLRSISIHWLDGGFLGKFERRSFSEAVQSSWSVHRWRVAKSFPLERSGLAEKQGKARSEFPKPFKLGTKTTRWRESEIQKFLRGEWPGENAH